MSEKNLGKRALVVNMGQKISLYPEALNNISFDAQMSAVTQYPDVAKIVRGPYEAALIITSDGSDADEIIGFNRYGSTEGGVHMGVMQEAIDVAHEIGVDSITVFDLDHARNVLIAKLMQANA